MLLIKPKIAKIVDKCMQPHLETIQHNKDALILQEIQNKNQNDQISSMKNKISNLEKRLEGSYHHGFLQLGVIFQCQLD
jgi:hypothetical protein